MSNQTEPNFKGLATQFHNRYKPDYDVPIDWAETIMRELYNGRQPVTFMEMNIQGFLAKKGIKQKVI